LNALPLFWAQATSSTPDAVRQLALRRWYDSLTLSSPLVAPSREPLALLLGGLGLVLALAVVFQGPRRALRQFIDLPGHLRLLGAAVMRCRNAGRTVAILLGAVVLTWTVSQFLHYRDESRLDDLSTFTATKTLGELALEQGLLAGLIPLRDLCGLGDCLLLLVGATGLVFKLSADRWGGTDDPYADLENPLPPWTTTCWGCAWLYAMYRFAGLIASEEGLPLGGCIFIEIIIIPLLMAMADGLVFAWILAELRNAGLSDDAGARLDVRGAVQLWPSAVLACLLVMPARYVATGAWLFLQDLPNLATVMQPVLAPLLLGWGLAALQAAAWATLGLAGAAAWSGGRVGPTLRGYAGMLRHEGGHLAGVLALIAWLAAIPAGLAYAVVLSLPRQTWVLAAADSYAHYVTLPVGLLCLAALVELGMRSLPRAGLASAKVNEPMTADVA
jgi:hypothetical protein